MINQSRKERTAFSRNCSERIRLNTYIIGDMDCMDNMGIFPEQAFNAGLFQMIFLITLGIMAFVIILFAIRFLGYLRAPVVTVKAKVLKKKKVSNKINHHHDGVIHIGPMKGIEYFSYYVSFQPEIGDELYLSIDEKHFEFLEEGEEGMLAYKGDCFEGFKKLS